MAQFFHHLIIRKYTLGLLDTFNNLQVQRTMSDGSLSYKTVPITFGTRDKAFTMTQMDIEQWKNNNYNVLPRMSLAWTSMNKEQKRDTNKLHTINKNVNGKVLTFQYNAVAFTFNFELSIATRGMNELTMLIEQIAPHFNPTYNLRILELDIQEEPSTVPVHLNNIELDINNNIGQDDDIRILGAVVHLEVRGNLYQPFTDSNMIENVRLYFNSWDPTMSIADTNRSIKYEFDVDANTHIMKQGTLFKTDWVESGTIGKNPPSNWYLIAQDGTVMFNQQGIPILSPGSLWIDGPENVDHNTNQTYKVMFIDVDNETGFTYIWNVLGGNASIIQNNKNPVSITFNGIGDVVLLQCQVMDAQGNISNYTTKSINIV